MKNRLYLLFILAIASPARAVGPFVWAPGGQAAGLQAGGTTYIDHSTNADGPTNLIKNGSFEDPYVSGWATYNDGAAAAPVDGTGGSASNITALAQDTTTADLIAGRGTAQLVKSAANAQGQGWSYDFAFPTKSTLYSTAVALSFDYYMSTAAVSDVVRVYIYDKDNTTLITPTFTTCGGGATPSLTSTTTPCHAVLSWLATAGVNYRLIFHTASTSATAVTTFV